MGNSSQSQNMEGDSMQLKHHTRKSSILILAGILILSLTGCGENVIPDMTKDEIQKVGEYAAITLLKYDANHRSRLVGLQEEINPEQKPTEDTEPTQQPIADRPEQQPVNDTPVVDLTEEDIESFDSMETALGLTEGITVAYTGSVISDRYPTEEEPGTFIVPAEKGCKIVALEFVVTNNSGTEQKIDMSSKALSFAVVSGNNFSEKSLSPVLYNDLAKYNDTLMNESGKKVVLLFQVEEAKAEISSGILLKIKNEGKIYTICLE